MAKNFKRALRHLRSNHKTTKLDEKTQMLNEIPNMNTGGVYSKNPAGFRYDPPSPAKRFVPDVDGNWPSGVPGTSGASEYIRPQGYWIDDSDWDTKYVPDMSNDSILESSTNTDGFIDPDTGTVKTALPPNSRHFILGPLVDGYVYNHGTDDYTNIGYIQKDTRQFVLLATIEGHWTNDPIVQGGSTYTPRQWNGTSGQFTQNNPSFTLAMAEWFKDKKAANNFTKDFPYFYSGGVPQQGLDNQPPGSPGGMKGGNAPGTNGGGNGPGDVEKGKATTGSGGSPDVGTETPQADPEGGDSGDLDIWGLLWDKAKKGAKNLWDIASGQYSNTPLKGALNTLRGFTDKAMFGSGDYIFKGLEKGVDYLPSFTGASNLKLFGKKIPKIADWNPLLKRLAGKNYASQYFTPDLNTALKYAGEGGTVTAIPRTGGVRGIKNWLGSNVSRGFDPTKGVEQLVRTSDTIALKNLTKTFDVADPASKQALETLAKKGVKNAGVLGRVGKFVPFLNAGLVVADVTARLSKQPPDYAGALLGGFQAIPGPVGWIAMGAQLTYDVGGGYDTMNNFYGPKINALKKNLSSKGPMKGSRSRFGEEYISEQNESALPPKEDMSRALIEMGLPKNKEDYIAEMGTYLTLLGVNPQLLSILLLAVGGKELSKDQKKWVDDNFVPMITGISKLDFSNKDLDPDNPLSTKDDPWALDKQQTQSESTVLYESKKRILREITQPLKEIKELPKTQKLEKYRPNFKGKYKPQNTPNVTASKKSDEMVRAKNAAGQTWRTKDKYWGGYESQERINVVYDKVGHGHQYFDKIVSENLSKKNLNNRKIQEHFNIIAHEKAMRKLDSTYVSPFRNIQEQETLDAPKDPLYKKVAKRLNTEIDYPNKPSAKGYPNEAPPELDPNTSMHPKYGQRYKYDKLDPDSAEAMPPTDNPEIDANVQKSLDVKRKARKIKNLLGKK